MLGAERPEMEGLCVGGTDKVNCEIQELKKKLAELQQRIDNEADEVKVRDVKRYSANGAGVGAEGQRSLLETAQHLYAAGIILVTLHCFGDFILESGTAIAGPADMQCFILPPPPPRNRRCPLALEEFFSIIKMRRPLM